METGKDLRSIKVALVTNIPSPYRVLQFDHVNKSLGKNFCVFYCARITSVRKWDIPNLEHNHKFLKESYLKKQWFNIDIFGKLKEFQPDVIITSGFYPTALISFMYSKYYNKKHIVLTDSWLEIVKNQSWLHRILRRIVFKMTDAFICIGTKGQSYLKSYGAMEEQIFTSPLAIDNDYYSKFIKLIGEREYDIMFSGQFIEGKMPYFLINIVEGLYVRNRMIKLLIIGSGPLKDDILKRLDELNVKYAYPGFIQQPDLPRYYANSRILLFPTREDRWGLVANEACAVGTPVITCNNAGAANDLIIHDFNGFVLPLNVDLWVNHVIELLDDKNRYNYFSQNAYTAVQRFSIEHASQGIIRAINYISNSISK